MDNLTMEFYNRCAIVTVATKKIKFIVFMMTGGGVTDALSKISSSAEVDRKKSRDSSYRSGKHGLLRHLISEEDSVDISDEARNKGRRDRKQGLLEILEEENH